MSELKESSKQRYSTDAYLPTKEELKIGALLRIADATELMTKRYQDLLDDRDRYKRRYEELCNVENKLYRRISALRGVITKLKKEGLI